MAKQSLNNYQEAQKNWSNRFAIATSRGYAQKDLMGLYQSDMTKVLQGGTPMSDSEAMTGLLAAHNQQSPIQQPQQGLTLNPFHDIMVGAKDVGNIIRGFPGGVGHLLAHLPSEATNTAQLLSHSGEPDWLKAHGYNPNEASSIGDLFSHPQKAAASLQNLAQPSGLTQLVPGIWAGGLATTPQGREQLSQHPVSAALDVAPDAAAAARIGGVGAKAAGVAGKPGGAMEALQASQPYRAAGRAGNTLVSKATGGAIDPVHGGALNPRANIVSWAEKMNIDEKARNLFFRPVNQQTGTIKNIAGFTPEGRALQKLIGDHRSGMLGKVAKLSEQERNLMTEGQKTRRFENGTMTWDNPVTNKHEVVPYKLQAVFSDVDMINRQVNNLHLKAGTAIDVPIGNGKFETMYVNGPQASAWRKVSTAQNKIPAAVEKVQRLQESAIKTMPKLMQGIEELKRDPAKLRGSEFDKIKFTADRLQKSTDGARNELGKVMGEVYTETKKFHEALDKNPPQRWIPFAQDAMRKSLQEHLTGDAALHATKSSNRTMTEASVANVLEQLNDPKFTEFSQLKGLVGEEAYNKLASDAAKSWLEMADKGFDPVVMHNVKDENAYRFAYQSDVIAERAQTPEWFKNRLFDQSPGISDVAIGATAGASEVMGRNALRGILEQFVLPKQNGFTGTRAQLREEYRHALSSRGNRGVQAKRGVSATVERDLNRDYVPISGTVLDPRKVGIRDPLGEGDSEVMVRKSLVHGPNSAAMLVKRGELEGGWNKVPFVGAHDPFMQVFKYSVLTGPRHLVHVVLGGLMMATLRESLSAGFIPKAISTYRKGEAWPELHQPIYEFGDHDLFHFAAGKTIGRIFGKVIGDPAHALARFEERAASVLRISTALAKQAKGADREAALREALKTYIDMNGMTPIERTVIRSIFPFYAFTKHIMRYILEYPQDHPLRTAFLTVLANNEIQDYNTGLPTKFAQMFFLGPTDPNGNVTAIDYKNINPFRSLANDFTVMGFVSSLNPALTTTMSAMGVNVLSGTPELFPDLQYDPYSGSLQANVPDKWEKALSQFIPEFGAIDHFAQFSSSMRALAKNNPTGFRRQLLTSLNIPFETTKVNLPYERAKAALNEYKVAQAAVGQARKTGDWSKAEQFTNVPFQKGLYDPKYLAGVYQQEKDRMNIPAGVSPNALVPRKPFKPSPLL